MSRKKWQHYGDSFKILVVEEFLAGQQSKSALCRKHCIPTTAQLNKWIRIFAPEYKIGEMSEQQNNHQSTESEQIKSLKRALQQKEIALRKEKLRADFYEEMVKIAEETFNIPIRKKSGAKQ